MTQTTNCPYCSGDYVKVVHQGTCPKVRAIEYFPDGTVKRVEFLTPKDQQPLQLSSMPPNMVTWGGIA